MKTLMKENRAYWRSAAALAFVLLGMLAATTAAFADDPKPSVYSPKSKPYDRSYAEWSVKWWQWALAIDASHNPILDSTGANCAVGQSGQVWFLAGSPGGAVTRDCAIPAEKAILFPIINVENSYPCPDPNFKPAAGQSLQDFLTNGAGDYFGARDYMDLVTQLEVQVDGVKLKDPFKYRATSKMYTFTGDPSLTAAFDGCITGSPQKAVSDGYWIMLKPLSKGKHTLYFRGRIDVWGYDVAATYNLTVVEK